MLAQRDRDTYSNPSANALEVVGQVRVVETGLPASRVPIRLERFGGGVIDSMDTDSSGHFRFANLQRGYYKVIVNAPGFKPVQQDADLQVVFRAYLVFELTADKGGAMTLIDVVDARAPAEPHRRKALLTCERLKGLRSASSPRTFRGDRRSRSCHRAIR